MYSHWKWVGAENENTINLKSASFVVIMLSHEGLTHIHWQKKPRLHFSASFTLTGSSNSCWKRWPAKQQTTVGAITSDQSDLSACWCVFICLISFTARCSLVLSAWDHTVFLLSWPQGTHTDTHTLSLSLSLSLSLRFVCLPGFGEGDVRLQIFHCDQTQQQKNSLIKISAATQRGHNMMRGNSRGRDVGLWPESDLQKVPEI